MADIINYGFDSMIEGPPLVDTTAAPAVKAPETAETPAVTEPTPMMRAKT